MPVEHKEEKQGMSQEAQAAVKEAIQEVFRQLAPVLQSIALTPEKIREANKPYVDPADIEREEREKVEQSEQFKAIAEKARQRQESCEHKDENEKWAINLIHNYPDHQPRGACPLCFLLLQPAHWEIAANPKEAKLRAEELGTTHKGKGYIVPEHPKYFIVRNLERAGK